MKANEAPEKLYFGESDKSVLDIYSGRESDDEIEYIRTDAFIEKAWNWIEDNILSSNQQDKSRLYYKQFRNYMKGE